MNEVVRPERKPRITPMGERLAQADRLVAEVNGRYRERYKGEPELFDYALKADHYLLTDYIPTPRPSYGEEQIVDNMQNWTQKMGMEFEKDDRGNAVGILRGDPKKVIVLQGHGDIVADAVEGSPINPHVDSIIPEHIEGRLRDLVDKETYDEELWLQAQNALTSLGADNGAGGAIIRATVERLKVLKEKSPHPEEFPTIIVLQTVEEEAHLGGVKNLSFREDTMNLLANADFIVNNDMETDKPQPQAVEGAFGLESILIDMPTEHQPIDDTLEFLTVNFTGFTGGHSGLYPDLQHAGVALIQEINEVLGHPGEKADWHFASFVTGNGDNQIAQNAHAVIAVPKSQADIIRDLSKLSTAMQDRIKDEPKARISVENTIPENTPQEILTSGSTKRVFELLTRLASLQGSKGSFSFRGKTLYSKAFNLGEVRLSPYELHAETTTRIGEKEAFGYYPPLIQEAATETNAVVTMKEPVKIWEPDESSPLPAWLKQAYQELNFDKGKYPNYIVDVVTAGLELGELHERFPRSKNITLGIWIDRIHKPGERMQIPSFLENAMLFMKFTDRLVAELMSPSAPEYLSRRDTAQAA